MEIPITTRFNSNLKALKLLIEEIRNENKTARTDLLDFEIFPERAIEDAVYDVINKDQLSLRIVLLNVPNLASNLSKVFETLLIPYKIKLDAGSLLLTQSFELYPYHASKNSALELDNFIIRDGADIHNLMSQLGWSLDSSEKLQDNSRFIEMLIENQEERFGIHSNSKFNFAELCYVEIYIDCNQLLVKQWQQGIEN